MRLKFLFLILFAVLAANVAILADMPDAHALTSQKSKVAAWQCKGGTCVHLHTEPYPWQSSCAEDIPSCTCDDSTATFTATMNAGTMSLTFDSLTGGCDEGQNIDINYGIFDHECGALRGKGWPLQGPPTAPVEMLHPDDGRNWGITFIQHYLMGHNPRVSVDFICYSADPTCGNGINGSCRTSIAGETITWRFWDLLP